MLNITECFNFKLHISDANHTSGHAQDLAYTLELDIDCTHCDNYQGSYTQEGVDRFIENFCCNTTTDVKDIELLIQSFNDQCSMFSVDLVAPLKTRTRAVS